MPTASFTLTLTATNYAKVRRAIGTMADSNWYRGIIRDTAHDVLKAWTSYAGTIAHRLTGHLSDSFLWEYDSHTSTGHVYINPRIVYRRGQSNLQWPHIYGPYEHARGGSHAFFASTLQDKGHLAETYGMRALTRGIPRP